MSNEPTGISDEELMSLGEVPREASAMVLAAGQQRTFRLEVDNEKHRLRVSRTAKHEVEREELASTSAKPYDIGTVAQVLARPSSPPDRVSVVVPSDGGTLIVAQRKTGKTTFMLNLAKSLVSGADFLDAFASRRLTGKIGFLNYEVNGNLLARWASEVGDLADQMLLVNLRGRRNPLDDPNDRTELSALLREQDVEALMVDTFSRAYTGQNQNDAGEVGRFLSGLDTFAREEVGATDLFLTTHAGWKGDRTRGSSALEDWADSVITLTTSDDTPDAQRYIASRGRGDATLEESKLMFHAPSRHMSLGEEGSRRQATALAKTESLVPFVLRAIGNEGDLGTEALCKAVRNMGAQGQDHAIRKAAKAAEQQGLVQRVSLGPGKKTMHRLTTPSNPVQSHSADGPTTPSTPSYRDGVGVGRA